MALIKHVGENWYARFQFRGKSYLRSTGTHIKEAAARYEKNLRRQLTEGRIEELKKLGEIRPAKVHTIGEVLALYTAEGSHERAGIKLLTLKRNAEALRRFVAVERGIKAPDLKAITKLGLERRVRWAKKRELRAAHQKKVDALPLTVLTEQSVYTFQANGLKLEFRAAGLNSTLNQARSVFSTPARFFSSIVLPDLKGFMAGDGIPQSHGDSAFQEIPTEVLAEIEADAKKERDAGNVDLWRTYLLFRRLGLRNIEIKAATGDWIAEHKGKLKLCIINRPGVFHPKAKIERRIALSAELLAEFSSILPGEHLIAPKATKTRRAEIVDRDCNVLVRRHLPKASRQKACYELRKQAGAEIASDPNGGIYQAHKFLGHSNIGTTEKHYSAYIGELNALEH